jgi:hypothetical protein
MIQFFDPAGNVIAFKPGNTWFQLASSNQNNGKPAVTYAP